MATSPTIHGIKFSADDIRFLDVQAENNRALNAFVILLALETVLDVSTRVRDINRVADLMEPMLKTTFNVLTPSWGDAAQALAQISHQRAFLDTQMHTLGKFMHYGVKFKAPTGKAKAFFMALLVDYSGRVGRSSPKAAP